VRRGAVRAIDRVAVIGGGSIGQLAIVASRAVGASVDLEARHDHQRAAGERLGAGTIDSDYDVVIEAAGTASALARAIEICRPGGRVVVLGTYWEPVELPGQTLSMKEITIVPASLYARFGPSRDVDVAAAVLAARPEIADVVLTHRFPLDAASEAFIAAADRHSGAIKVVLEP
jgi:threonine dehydrogenase-like Zn-dependent dehydrogenase